MSCLKVDSNATLANAPFPELPGGQGEQSLATGYGATRDCSRAATHAAIAARRGLVEAMRSVLRAYLRFANVGHINRPSRLRAEKRLFG